MSDDLEWTVPSCVEALSAGMGEEITTLPERIYIPLRNEPQWAEVLAKKDPDNAEVEYVRADLIEELEANLAKAVEALESIVSDCEADYPPSHGAIKYFARTTLAKLKGQGDE